MLTLLMLVAIGQTDGKDAKQPAPPKPAATAEDALRGFLIAMLSKDEPTLRAVTLPDDEFDWLLKGSSPPKLMLPVIAAQMRSLPIRALKVGDVVPIGKDKMLAVAEAEVGPDRAVLLPEGHPLPFRCRKVDGAWKVDARPVIAGRKAAAAAKEKAEKAAGEGSVKDQE